MKLTALEGQMVAVLIIDPKTKVGTIYTGVLRWGGKRGHRVVTCDGTRIYSGQWALLLPLSCACNHKPCEHNPATNR